VAGLSLPFWHLDFGIGLRRRRRSYLFLFCYSIARARASVDRRRLGNHSQYLFSISQEFLIFGEVVQRSQEDDSHFFVYTVNDVGLAFLRSEDERSVDAFFELVEFVEFQLGTIKNVLYEGMCVFTVF